MRRRTLILSAAALGAAPLILRTARAASASMVEKFAQTLSAHDLDAFAALFADGYVNHQSSAAAHPPAGVPAEDGDGQFLRRAAQGPARPQGLHPGEPRRGRQGSGELSLRGNATRLALWRRADRETSLLHLVRHLPLSRRQDRRTLGHGRHCGGAGAAEGIACRPGGRAAARSDREGSRYVWFRRLAGFLVGHCAIVNGDRGRARPRPARLRNPGRRCRRLPPARGRGR